MQGKTPESLPPGPRVTPGGFHAFEHRWALAEAFRFHLAIGKPRVAGAHPRAGDALQAGAGRHRRQGEAAHADVRRRCRPASPASRSTAWRPNKIVERLFEKKIIASDSPYATSYARLTPGLLNTPEEVDRAVAEVKALAV